MRKIRKDLISLALTAVTFCILPASSLAQARIADELTVKLDEYLSVLTSNHKFSGSVLVARGDTVFLKKGYGFENEESRTANSPQTKFRIASLTKQFTAIAILMLQERGLLKVTDSVCRYIRPCPVAWRRVTIHNLLTHSSGIKDFDDLPDAESWPDCMPVTVDRLIRSFSAKRLDFTPGSRFSYSNSNYALLGRVIEVLSQASYETFLQENIFKPLKMNHSGYDHAETILEHRAAGYQVVNGRVINAPFVHMSGPYAAGGLYSTIEDLYLWDRSLKTDKLVSGQTMEKIFTPFKGDYGYGWWIEKNLGRLSNIHSGQIDGFVCNITRFPTEDTTIIALSNLETSKINEIALHLASIVFAMDKN